MASSIVGNFDDEPFLGKAFGHLKQMFPHHTEADIMRVIKDFVPDKDDESLIPKCIERLFDIPARSESTGQQNKGLDRGPLSPVQQDVMKQLHTMFPDVPDKQIKTSVRHTSNTFEPLSTPTLLQRCIDDLLDGRTAPDVCFLSDGEEEEVGDDDCKQKIAATTPSKCLDSGILLDDKILSKPASQTITSTNDNKRPAKPTCTVSVCLEEISEPVLGPESHLKDNGDGGRHSGTDVGEVVKAAALDTGQREEACDGMTFAAQQAVETVPTSGCLSATRCLTPKGVRHGVAQSHQASPMKSVPSVTVTDLRKVTTAETGADLWKSTASETGIVLKKVTTAQTGIDLNKPSTSKDGFGLDKPSTSQNSFGLDKPSMSQNGFGLDKPSTSRNSFGLGKPSTSQKSYDLDLDKPNTSQTGIALDRTTPATSQHVVDPQKPATSQTVTKPGETATSRAFASSAPACTNLDKVHTHLEKASTNLAKAWTKLEKEAVADLEKGTAWTKSPLKVRTARQERFSVMDFSDSDDDNELITPEVEKALLDSDDDLPTIAIKNRDRYLSPVPKASNSRGTYNLPKSYPSPAKLSMRPSTLSASQSKPFSASMVTATGDAHIPALQKNISATSAMGLISLSDDLAASRASTSIPVSMASGIKGLPTSSSCAICVGAQVDSLFTATSLPSFGKATVTTESSAKPVTSAEATGSALDSVDPSKSVSAAKQLKRPINKLPAKAATGPSLSNTSSTSTSGVYKERTNYKGAPETVGSLYGARTLNPASSSHASSLPGTSSYKPVDAFIASVPRASTSSSTSGLSGSDASQKDFSPLSMGFLGIGRYVNDGTTSYKPTSLGSFMASQGWKAPFEEPTVSEKNGQSKENPPMNTIKYAATNHPQNQWRSSTKEKASGKHEKKSYNVKKSDSADGGHDWRKPAETLKDVNDLPSNATLKPGFSIPKRRLPATEVATGIPPVASSVAVTSTVTVSTAAISSMGDWRSHSKSTPIVINSKFPARTVTGTQVSGPGLTLQNTFPLHAPPNDGTLTIESRYKITYQGKNLPTNGPAPVVQQDINANQKPAAHEINPPDLTVPRAKVGDIIELTDDSSNDSLLSQDVVIEGTVNMDHSVRFIREELPMDVDGDNPAVLVLDDDDRQDRTHIDPVDHTQPQPDRRFAPVLPKPPVNLPDATRLHDMPPDLAQMNFLEGLGNYGLPYPAEGPPDPMFAFPNAQRWRKKKKRKKSGRRNSRSLSPITPIQPFNLNAEAGVPLDLSQGGATGTALDLVGGLDLTGPEPPGSSKADLKNDILALFPDIDPAHVDTLVVAHSGPMALNNICNGLLEAPYPKKRQPAPTSAPTATVTSAQMEKVDYFKDYKSVTIPWDICYLYNSQAYAVLSTDFSWISGKDIKYVMAIFDEYYAPSYQELGLIWKRAVEESKKQRPNAINRQYNGLAFAVEIEADGIKKKLNVRLLKNRRPAAKIKKDIIPELQREIEFVKTRLAEIAKEADQEVAMQLNEQEYSAEGQSIECGCCYGEYSFESMIQCCEGHLFCQTCLKSYAKEAVYGQGKADLKCMTDECDASFPKSQLTIALPSEMLAKYEDRIQEENINLAELADLVRCPHCDYAALMDPQDKVFACMKCEKATCRHCKENWEEHFGKRCEEVEKKDETKLRLAYEEKMTAAKVRTCHKCKAQFTKEDGCNKMTCRCGATMCYICREPKIHYDHFCRHARDPGKDCTTCTACSLWTNPEEDDNRAIKEIQKEADEMRKEKGYTEERLIGAPDEPPAKKAKR